MASHVSFEMLPVTSDREGSPANDKPERRKRVTQGDLCSEQRAKCDSLKPCARCLKRGTECTYNRQPKRRGPPKGTANTMRERLNRLEAIYGAVKAEELLANGGMTSLGSMNGLRAMSSSGSMSGGDDEPMSPNGHFSPAQMVDVKPTMAQLAASSRQLDAAGARMTIGSILTPPASRPTPSSTSSSIAPTRTAHSSTPPLFLMTSDSHISLMLPPEVFSSVMDTYFTLIYPTMPIIHRWSLEHTPHFYPPALLFTIMAISVRLNTHHFFDSQAVRDQWADCFFEQAHKLLQPMILEPKRVNYHMVVAIIHLTKYFDHFKASVLMSLRGTELIFLLLREANLEEASIAQCPLPRWVQFEEFRRLRWTQYFHDRCLVYGTGTEGRRYSLSLASLVNMKFPMNDRLWFTGDATEPIQTSAPITLAMFERDMSTYPIFMGDLAPFSRQIVLFSIFEKIIGFLNNTPDAVSKEEITHKLATWYECQPPAEKSLSSGAAPSHSTIFLMLVYHTLMVIIHSPPRIQEMWEDDSWLLSQDFLIAAEHAGLCTSYLEVNPQALQFAPYFVKICVQRVFCMHFMLAQKLSHEQSFQVDLRRKVQLHIHALAVMGKTDKMSAVTAKLLTLVADGSFGDNAPVSEGMDLRGFSPEELQTLADVGKARNPEHTGFWPQMGSFINRIVGGDDSGTPTNPEL